MIGPMKRHEIQVLRAAGHTQEDVAERTKTSVRSVRRIEEEAPVLTADERGGRGRRGVGRPSCASPFLTLVKETLAEDPDLPTVEILRRAREKNYRGAKTALYALVASVRVKTAKPIVRFEGVAGEFSQHDFGEVKVRYVSGKTEKLTFFASKMKFSRFAHVVLVKDQRVESLVRALILGYQAFGGVPLVSVFDNPKTIVLSHKDQQIEWNATFGQAVLDLRVAPDLCYPHRPNQKGAVERLVGWVKNSFFKARRFQDREDAERQLAEWLEEVNTRRPSRATGVIPSERLAVEKERLRPLPVVAADYALRFPVVVGPTALVEHDGYRYSMPPRAIGITGTLFLHPERVRIVAARHDVWHDRFPEHGRTSYRPEDRAATLAEVSGERARLYYKRQQLLELGGIAEQFLTEVVHLRRMTWKGDVEHLYELFLDVGPDAMLVAMARAHARNLHGAQYVVEELKEIIPGLFTTDCPYADALRSPRIDPRGLDGVLAPERAP
jgi:transposase